MVAVARHWRNTRSTVWGGAFSRAVELRKSGISFPIVILCGIRTREEAEAVVSKGLIPTLFDPAGSGGARSRKRKKENLRKGLHQSGHGYGPPGVAPSELALFLNQVTAFKEIQIPRPDLAPFFSGRCRSGVHGKSNPRLQESDRKWVALAGSTSRSQSGEQRGIDEIQGRAF